MGSYMDGYNIWYMLVQHGKILTSKSPGLSYSLHKMQSVGNRIFQSIIIKKAYYIKTLWRGSICLKPKGHGAPEKPGRCYIKEGKGVEYKLCLHQFVLIK